MMDLRHIKDYATATLMIALVAISTLAVAFSNRDLVVSATPIYTVQGTGEKSPLAGETVTLEGVVVGDFQGQEQLNGFFLQDRKDDNNPATSDSIFVYVPPGNKLSNVDVKPGDQVVVQGSVTEYKEQTQLDRVTEIKVRAQAALPPPAEIRLPLPTAGAFESFEGMRVTFPEILTVSGNNNLNRYGELVVSADGRMFVPTNGHGGSAELNGRRRLIVDDGSTRGNPRPLPYVDGSGTRRVGDTVSGLTGVLSYAFGEYRLQPTTTPQFKSANPRPNEPASTPGDIKVASFNVHNYFTTLKSQNRQARGAQNADEFARQSAKVVAALRRLDADIVGLIEMENNGNTALNDLVTKLNGAYGAKTYDFVRDPAEGTGTDAIKVAFIYKPGRVDLNGPAVSDPDPISNRAPLAQTFRAKNAAAIPFTAVVNHFKSKGSCPATGDVDTGQGCWNQKRVQQAQALVGFINRLKERQGHNNFLILGDLNAYAAEDPVRALLQAGFTSLNGRVPPHERYSYVFDALSGELDHALATSTLAQYVTGVTIWHINADEPPQETRNAGTSKASTGDSQPAALTSSPYGSSDHDPLLLGLRFPTDGVASTTLGSPATARASRRD